MDARIQELEEILVNLEELTIELNEVIEDLKKE